MFARVLPSRSSLKSPQPLGLSASPLRLRFLLPSRIAVPVHPHLRNLPVLRLAEDRASRINLFTRTPAAERAPKFRRKPRPCRVDLPRREVRFSLMQWDVLPVR